MAGGRAADRPRPGDSKVENRMSARIDADTETGLGKPGRLDAFCFWCLAASAFFTPFSLPAGRAALAIAVAVETGGILWKLRKARFGRLIVPALLVCAAVLAAAAWFVHMPGGSADSRRMWLFGVPAGFLVASLVPAAAEEARRSRGNSPAGMAVAGWQMFLAVAAAATLWGADPEYGLPKLDKLLWFAGIPIWAVCVRSAERLRLSAGAYAAGCCVLGAASLMKQPLLASDLVDAGMARDLAAGLVATGSMTDAQRLMVGLLLSAGLLAAAVGLRARLWWAAAMLVQALAFIIQFKRGSWIAFVAASVFWAWGQRKRKAVLVALGAALVVAAAAPVVRNRFVSVWDELGAVKGGRLDMWTRTAPAIMRDHPWGVGWRCVTERMMRQYTPFIEKNRSHLHSNPVEIAVELGWIGLAVYVLWMAGALAAAALMARNACGSAFAPVAWSAFAALLALVLNGIVEFNLGDAEIVLVYAMLTGLAVAGRDSFSEAGSGRDAKEHR